MDASLDAAARDEPPQKTDSLRLFGAPVLVLASGATVAIEWGRSMALLAYLACEEGWHPREQLAVLLRPEVDATTARTYLRGIIHKIRQAIPDMTALRIEEGRLRWAGGSDVQAFRTAVARSDWERAISLQELPLLDRLGVGGTPFLDDWVEQERAKLRGELRRSMLALILQRQAAGGSSVDLMQRLVEDDPMDEDAVQFVLSQARNSLERHLAAGAFQALQKRLAAELGVKPLPSTVKLYEELRDRVDQQSHAAVHAPAAEPVSAPVPLEEPLHASHKEIPLGRAADFQKLVHLTQRPDVRLITISGFGGVGKSVLARSLFGWLSKAGDAACIWVDLVSADSLQAMLNTIALQAGLPEREKSMEEQLALWLSERRIVLFLDNVEQLAPHAAVLSRLLLAAPGLRIVATSREILQLSEEYSVPVVGLDYDGTRSAAARLLALHAERVGYRLDAGQDREVARLVQFLEGLPLAIELAASWLPLLGPGSMLEELQGNPSFLDEAAGRAGRNERTMASVLATAWRRLDAPEEHALAGLAVFEGPIHLEQAREVAKAEPAVLLRLVQKSMLQRIGGARFRLHPLLRDFVRVTAPADGLSQAQERHCEYMLGRLASMPLLKPSWDLPEEGREMVSQAEDLVKAWRYAVDAQRIDLMGHALPNLSILLHMGSRREEAAALCEHAQGRVPFVPIGAGLAALHAMTNLELGRMDDARRIALDALVQGPRGRAQVWLEICLSRLDWFNSDYEAALGHAERALAAVRPSHSELRVVALQDMALCRYALRQFARARTEAEESLVLARAQSAKPWEGRALTFLGVICSASGVPAQAIQYFLQALDLFGQPEAAYDRAYALRCLSYAYCLAGDGEKEVVAAEAALATFRSAGYYHELGDSLMAVGVGYQTGEQMARALEYYLQALPLCLQANNLAGVVRCIWLIGVMTVPRDRASGLLFASFALGHKALRPPDDVVIRKELAGFGFTPEEVAQGLESAAAWTLDDICGRVLSMKRQTQA
ncbi:ATP-binding protein [Ramlibacter humi]|uniref:Bacterial transcriptional activator domain-containing protein n=1 Tax=Ramlibacter humi TaxID=2530451 RepID=A0A4Z0BEY6_9BURK|nr:AAA family ATPase [Ramlibacter humi]TFY97023.1 hypothetical protein EZ216_19355 [Ramlibacter humi]